jgi:hypothetical protein
MPTYVCAYIDENTARRWLSCSDIQAVNRGSREPYFAMWRPLTSLQCTQNDNFEGCDLTRKAHRHGVIHANKKTRVPEKRGIRIMAWASVRFDL